MSISISIAKYGVAGNKEWRAWRQQAKYQSSEKKRKQISIRRNEKSWRQNGISR